MNRSLLVLIVLLALVLGFGFLRGWFTGNVAEAGGKPGIVLTWDKDKFKADMSAAGGQVKAMTQAAVDMIKGKAKSVSSTESEIEGKVIAVDVVNATVTIDSDGQVIPLTVLDTTGIEALRGKTVRVKLEKTADSFIVREIAEKR